MCATQAKQYDIRIVAEHKVTLGEKDVSTPVPCNEC